ncbi:hypothetical protein EYF80_061035 [Liparis tanakae]|uniref:Uncharacterized protein n=1 Tax=Liparis tanakae TaxID=230148 RepID=A0A4Z2EJ77_9TELE|nr:hypothetical protein EYF80_061035 [Liparis tanakae]
MEKQPSSLQQPLQSPVVLVFSYCGACDPSTASRCGRCNDTRPGIAASGPPETGTPTTTRERRKSNRSGRLQRL